MTPITRRRPSAPLALCLALVLAGALLAPAPLQGQRTDSLFSALTARAIGPSGTSGRVAALAAVGDHPDVIYVGAATGGVWKSTDAGYTWAPVFDDQPASSIGAVAVHPAQTDVVWVGTGEANVRNSMGHGRGVFKSMDGGETWTALGLEKSERVSRILLHPRSPDVAYVGALGPAWVSGGERGVYKTTDGGATWERILYVDENTGVAEMAMDPANPDHILVAMWEYRRWPWFFKSGGKGSGLYETWDGGRNWKRQSDADGLPEGELGRIGLAFATNMPNVVYALVEAKSSELLRSTDGGRTWSTITSGPNASPRPFYYSRIYVDPANENRIYRLHTFLERSDDAGRTFYQVGDNGNTVHLDHHALWVSPDGRTVITGNDGGVYLSHNRGETWRFVENLPLSQFYHISVDMEMPYNVYGGLQDNGAWVGPSQVWVQPGFTGSVIQAQDWLTIGFGDGFVAQADPTHPHQGYSSWQGGNLQRFDLRNGEWKNIRPPDPDTVEMRYNWNAGFALDPFTPTTLYYGSQFLQRSRDRGQSWEIISPDLTTDDPEKQRQVETGGLTYDDSGAENHTTILAIAPSPLERGVIWVGTDDGNVQVTRDDGATWTNTSPRLPGIEAGAWVPHVEASRHVAGRAYVVVNDHRRGDWGTYLFRTDDYGNRWRNLATADLDGPVHIAEEDPVQPGLLWAGTEFGLFFSLDAGASSTKWTHGFPTVPVYDIVTHPRDHDLVVGTHGRGMYVIDDIQPVRAVAGDPALADTALAVFPIADAILHNRGITGPFYFPGHTQFEGVNRPAGALVTYRLGDVEEGDTVRVEILDASGAVIRRVNGADSAGVHRWVWPLSRDGYWGRNQTPSADSIRPAGVPVLPGRYTVRVSVGSLTSEAPVRVLADPRVEIPEGETRERIAAMEELFRMDEGVGIAMRRIAATVTSLDAAKARAEDLPESEARDTLMAHIEAAKAAADSLRNEVRPAPPAIQGFRRNDTMGTDFGNAYGRIGSASDALTQGDREAVATVRNRVRDWTARYEALYAGTLASLEAELRAAGVPILDLGG